MVINVGRIGELSKEFAGAKNTIVHTIAVVQITIRDVFRIVFFPDQISSIAGELQNFMRECAQGGANGVSGIPDNMQQLLSFLHKLFDVLTSSFIL
jgi:hypothetical protein